MSAKDLPAIVQSDLNILLEVDSPLYTDARDALAAFAELVKSPEHIHTYCISPLSLWNAAAAGLSVDEVCLALERYSRYEIPENVLSEIQELMARYGKLQLIKDEKSGELSLQSDDPMLFLELLHHKEIAPLLGVQKGDRSCEIDKSQRGVLKQALIQFGYPAQDLAGYTKGEPLEVRINSHTTSTKESFQLRDYQQAAADVFYASGGVYGGSGTIVLPCGAGKTLVGIACMANVQANTLILVPNIVAARQWRRELLERTNLSPEQIGEYSGETKEIKPVTIATYQVLIHRKSKNQAYQHFHLLDNPRWGFIVYDEVHLLPAPVFRVTAELQARRRLGLTATLVREDGLESDVFALIGPKKYEVPWKILEKAGWIAPAQCTEIRTPLPDNLRMKYAVANDREKFRIASENPDKEKLIEALLAFHKDDQVLIIGQYLEQLDSLAKRFDIPLIVGKTSTKVREKLYQKFRQGEISKLILSRVGNFAVDLPSAAVLIQVSGVFGSRQEEAQRLGRIVRPQEDKELAAFYSLVSRDTKEQNFASNRQLFLVEQGYRYNIMSSSDVFDGSFEKFHIDP